MMAGDICKRCKMMRPRWHGGSHQCLVVGKRYTLSPRQILIDAAELAWLRIPFRRAA